MLNAANKRQWLIAVVLGAAALFTGLMIVPGGAGAAGIGPVQGGVLPGPLPLFPADNWWNLDITSWPVDPGSASYISFINTGHTGGATIHPDFGGEVSPGSVDIYGMPYAVVDGTQPKLAVTFQYWDESDGVDYSTGQGIPFYPIPAEAITQPHWVEGGAPGNVDQRSKEDRHLLIVDRDNKYLYELYNVFYDSTQGKWYAGSGAFFDMSTNSRRPEGWTSADAAGLAILPGLVRYDEAYGLSAPAIQHAIRATVRTTNGYVYPASHVAGSTLGALPMGARLRLKASKTVTSSDPGVQAIVTAMKKYGLIIADNGSDMYITGTFDTRWSNDVLNPALGQIGASDFEVIQLGYNPPSGPPALASVSASPNPIVGGNGSTGVVSLTSGAPSGGALVTLSSSNAAVASVPGSVTIGQGVTSTSFGITTSAVASSTGVTISATYGAVTKTTVLTVNPVPPPTLSSLTLNPTAVSGGSSSTGTVVLSGAAPSGGAVVALTSSKPSAATVQASVTVTQGNTSATFIVNTATAKSNTSAVITGTYGGTSKSATLTIKKTPRH